MQVLMARSTGALFEASAPFKVGVRLHLPYNLVPTGNGVVGNHQLDVFKACTRRKKSVSIGNGDRWRTRSADEQDTAEGTRADPPLAFRASRKPLT